MGSKIPDGISRDDVNQALKDFDARVPHQFLDSTTYDLVVNGKCYPPKAIIGLAARRLTGVTLTPKDFKGGEGTHCFHILRKLGFQVVKKDGSQPTDSFSVLTTEETSSQGFVEGATRTVVVNRYERDPAARSACIEYYGAVCVVCGFDFGKIYGELGEGFIHVHHLRELATIGTEYVVDPIEDLRPVCPNCHAMLHRDVPAIGIDKLASVVQRILQSSAR